MRFFQLERANATDQQFNQPERLPLLTIGADLSMKSGEGPIVNQLSCLSPAPPAHPVLPLNRSMALFYVRPCDLYAQ
jgi:hypothetical protein